MNAFLPAFSMAIANNIALTTPRLKARKLSLKVQWLVVVPVELALLALLWWTQT